MKKMKLAITVFCAFLVSAAVFSCDPDPTPAPLPEDTAVAGSYKGEMTCSTVEVPEATVVGTESASLEMKDREIIFASFPRASIITAILGAEEAPAIIEAVGDVEYKIAFTPSWNEDESEVVLKLNPAELKISVPLETEEGEEPETSEITVTLAAGTDGKYVVETKKLTFGLNITKITIGDEEMPEFMPLRLEFDMTKD